MFPESLKGSFLGTTSALLLLLALSAGAANPVEIAKLLPDDGVAQAGFGWSVAVERDTALVGAYADSENGFESGAVYVFRRAQGGAWTQHAKIVPNDAGPDMQFGFRVALSRNTALIGTQPQDESLSGVAYFFTRDANGVWTQQAKVSARDGSESDRFGEYVAIEGDIAILGAVGDDDNGENAGAAYVFLRNGTVWTEHQKLTADDGEPGNDFGRSVSIDGATVVIGSTFDDDNGRSSGSAYVFVRDSNNSWNQQAKLTASDGTAGDFFGEYVSVAGDTAMIGAPRDGGNAALGGLGSVYVFTRNGSVWSEQAKLSEDEPEGVGQYGTGVAISGDATVIGMPRSNDNRGAAVVLMRSGNTWNRLTKLFGSDSEAGDGFGGSVALHGDTALFGARSDDDFGSGSGSAYIFDLNVAADVTIDIKPKNRTNNVNLRSRGKITVAILTTESFDAVQVDPFTAEFGPYGAREPHKRGHVKDVDGDGDMDAILHFKTQHTGIACGDTEATLTAETFAGDAVTGTDVIRTRNCR